MQRAGPRRAPRPPMSGKGHSDSPGARPVHLIITVIKWIRTSRLSIKNSLSAGRAEERDRAAQTAQAGADLMWEARGG